MPANESSSITINTGETYTIPKGYYAEGATTVSAKPYILATNLSSNDAQTISVINNSRYKNLTADNFLIILKKIEWTRAVSGIGELITKDYNPETGTLTLNRFGTYFSSGGTTWFIYDIYII